ncbi:nucleoside phosphorylase domain-containing protein [Trichoderma chlorosporum]
MSSTRPSRRDDFEIAIVCALVLEYNAVSLLFDQFWDQDGDSYGRAVGDLNTYTTGRIGKFDVVLALLPHTGKANAASAVAGMRSSYACLRLVLLVGICGGVPQLPGYNEILLGDVVISKTVVQYDFHKQYPDNIVRKNTFEDNLSKPVKDIRNLLATLETDLGLERLHERTAFFLTQLQQARQGYNYPGTAEDKLFKSTYTHRHRASRSCLCRKRGSSGVCDLARDSQCHELPCGDTYLVSRRRLDQKQKLESAHDARAQEPFIHFGAIASGDTVMKSGVHRDKLSKEEKVVAFETEGAGAWEEMPCFIVKGVCNYADCHKNDKWLQFAAATSASAAKAVLERYCKTDRPSMTISERQISLSGVLQEIDCETLVANLRAKKKRVKTKNSRLRIKNSRLEAKNDCLEANAEYLRRQVSDFIRVMGQLPRQILHDGFVTVIDALNRRFCFHLDTICTKQAFIEVLKGRFGDLGRGKIQREEWLLEDQGTGKMFNLQELWGSHMKPGQILCLSMIFWRRNVLSTRCPKCSLDNMGDIKEPIKCSCGLTYRWIEEIQHKQILEGGFQATMIPLSPEKFSSQQREQQSTFPGPRLPEFRYEDDFISRYSHSQVANISFQLRGLESSKIVLNRTEMDQQDLQNVQRLSTYLAAIYGLAKEDCLKVLNGCEIQVLPVNDKYEQGKADNLKSRNQKSRDKKTANKKPQVKKPKSKRREPTGQQYINQEPENRKLHNIYLARSCVTTWQCCQCGMGTFVAESTTQCTDHNCQHTRCNNCPVYQD